MELPDEVAEDLIDFVFTNLSIFHHNNLGADWTECTFCGGKADFIRGERQLIRHDDSCLGLRLQKLAGYQNG